MPPKPKKTFRLGERIKEVVEKSQIPKSRIAEKIGIDISYLYRIFDKDSLDTELLESVSVALDYNFMWDVMRESEKMRKLKNPVDLSRYNEETLSQMLQEPDVRYGKLQQLLDKKDEELSSLKDRVIAILEKKL